MCVCETDGNTDVVGVGGGRVVFPSVDYRRSTKSVAKCKIEDGGA